MFTDAPSSNDENVQRYTNFKWWECSQMHHLQFFPSSNDQSSAVSFPCPIFKCWGWFSAAQVKRQWFWFAARWYLQLMVVRCCVFFYFFIGAGVIPLIPKFLLLRLFLLCFCCYWCSCCCGSRCCGFLTDNGRREVPPKWQSQSQSLCQKKGFNDNQVVKINNIYWWRQLECNFIM